jgi:hypothetical protein
MHYRTAWSDFFPGTSPTTPLSPNEYTSRKTVSDTYVYVSDCLFNKCSSTSNGGAFYCNSATCLLVESSSFFSCKTSGGEGGAIYFSNSNNGECVLHRVCGYDCLTTYTSSPYEQFADISVKNSALSKNYVNYTSIARCVNENSNSYSALYLRNGKDNCLSVNLSMNKCGYQTGFSSHPFSDSSSVTCSLLYSTFTDNIVTNYVCNRFNNGNAKYEMKCCNFLRNSQVSSSCGLIEAYGTTTIEDSCILENSATYIFYTSSYTVTLSNCTVDKTTNNNGRLNIQNTVTKSFILALNHMSTQNCNAEYDSAGTLTAIIQNPSSSNTIICYITCKNNFNHQHIRDVISIIYIFMFNFIHQCPSTGP